MLGLLVISSLSLRLSLSSSSPSVHPPSSYLISLSHVIFKNMAHVGSFDHFVFVFVFACVFVIVITGHQWIVRVISFQKMYGLYGLKHHIVEISGGVTHAGRTNE